MTGQQPKVPLQRPRGRPSPMSRQQAQSLNASCPPRNVLLKPLLAESYLDTRQALRCACR